MNLKSLKLGQSLFIQAITFEKYKKLHPATKKTSNDPMFTGKEGKEGKTSKAPKSTKEQERVKEIKELEDTLNKNITSINALHIKKKKLMDAEPEEHYSKIDHNNIAEMDSQIKQLDDDIAKGFGKGDDSPYIIRYYLQSKKIKNLISQGESSPTNMWADKVPSLKESLDKIPEVSEKDLKEASKKLQLSKLDHEISKLSNAITSDRFKLQKYNVGSLK